MIQNCPITAFNITNAHTMFGKNIAATRGNKLQHTTYRVVIYYVAAPKYFNKLHKFETLLADVMFVNGAPFLINMSRVIKFVTVEHIPTHTDKN